MEDIKANEYFDRPCGSYEEFERIKAELEAQGFTDIGNSSTSTLYPLHPLIEEEYIKGREETRKKHNFRNDAEERTWDLKDAGFQVLRTQGFTVKKEPLESLVAFFVKPQNQ